MFRGTNVQGYQCSGLPMFRATNVQGYQCSGVPMSQDKTTVRYSEERGHGFDDASPRSVGRTILDHLTPRAECFF
jgi:hypothetical protein